MSYSDNFPSQRPSFMFDASNAGRIPPNMTYTRASTGSYFGTDKVLSSENLLPHSNDLSTWTSSSTTAPSTNNTAPDGTSTATEVSENTANSSHNRYKSFPATTGTNYTYLVFAKANGRTQFRIAPQATAVIASVKFDLTAVTASVISGSTVGTPSITAIGSTGWYRCELTVAATGSGNGYHQLDILDASGNGTYTGDGSSGFYFWGAQVSSTGETVLNETSGQIHREYQTKLQTAASGAARFEHSAIDGQSMGCLIEGQSTNHLIPSEDLSGWSTPANMTVSTNSMVAPDGSLTADVLTVSDDTVADGHFAYRNSTAATAGQSVTVSFFAKSTGVSQIYFFDNVVGAASLSIYDLNNGTVSGANSSNSSMIDCGNGWYRCTGTYTQTGSGENLRFYSYNGTTTTYIANGYDGFALWGVQVEQASFASSYIATEPSGSAVTRAADSLSMTDASLFGTGSGAVVVEAGPVNGTFYPTLFDLTDTTTSNRVLLQSGSTGTPTSLTVAADGNASVGVVSEAVTMSDRKFAVSYDTNSFKLVSNGGAVSEDTSGQLPQQLSKLSIGTDNGGGGSLNGNIKRIAVFGEPLSDSNLQAITS